MILCNRGLSDASSTVGRGVTGGRPSVASMRRTLAERVQALMGERGIPFTPAIELLPQYLGAFGIPGTPFTQQQVGAGVALLLRF